MTTSHGGPPQFLAQLRLNSDPWGRYYTSPEISRSLIDRIEVVSPKLVLELGSGSGSLCAAAAQRWQNVDLVTVDFDHTVTTPLQIRQIGPKIRHSHFIHDVLDEGLSDQIGVKLGSVDVAICNPPYIRPRWRSGFGKILEDAGLSSALTSLHDAGADLLFLAQNLRLLREFGKLGLILPDGLVTAEKFSRLRQVLLQQHSIKQVVQLPRNVFKGTEAQTYLAVLSKKGGETQFVSLRQMDHGGRLSPPIKVEQNAAAKRLDYTFHAKLASSRLRGNKKRTTSLRQALTDIVRGSICSSSIKSFPVPVFHLCDFPESLGEHVVRVVPKRFALSAKLAKQFMGEAHLAQPGDILVARVGRSLETHVARVIHGPCVISDCIFALRATEDHREKLYRFLESNEGRSALASSAHGVAARFLSKSNLFDIHF